MYVKIIAALVLVFSWATSVQAVPTISVGDHILQLDSPAQVIDILIFDDGQGTPIPGSPAGQISGIDLILTIGDGVGGPIVTNIDLIGPGLIFNANNVGQYDLGDPYVTPSRIPSAFTYTAFGSISANGVLARVTFDNTGVRPGYYPISLTGVLGPTNVGFLDVLPILINGYLTSIPEPSSVVMGLTGATAMFGLAVRKLRASRTV